MTARRALESITTSCEDIGKVGLWGLSAMPAVGQKRKVLFGLQVLAGIPFLLPVFMRVKIDCLLRNCYDIALTNRHAVRLRDGSCRALRSREALQRVDYLASSYAINGQLRIQLFHKPCEALTQSPYSKITSFHSES